jgi:hypothetical protein
MSCEFRELEKLCGRDCVVKLKNGEELNGAWREGKREGLGALYSPRLEKVRYAHCTIHILHICTGSSLIYDMK